MSTTKQTTSRSRKSKAQAGASATNPSGRKARAGRKEQTAAAPLGSEERQQMIAVAAYRKASERGFAPGHEIDDWLAAEQELEGELARP